MNDMILQNTIVTVLCIVGFSVFGFGMFVWITERPKRLYNWSFEFPKKQKLTEVKHDV